ncbi:hypothetical protein E4U40_001165 [Claviceps sp. LM458 group G5]|nr:hypothetical protein E4U40_001165 [Claviceps sp. LM458 group G5]KAG6043854.1 hypothetical protein E4U39_004047 [Claviceps sp. Clav50 group G5]
MPFFFSRARVEFCCVPGLDSSQPNNLVEITNVLGEDAEQDFYRHPDARDNGGDDRQRFKNNFDMYSLGDNDRPGALDGPAGDETLA